MYTTYHCINTHPIVEVQIKGRAGDIRVRTFKLRALAECATYDAMTLAEKSHMQDIQLSIPMLPLIVDHYAKYFKATSLLHEHLSPFTRD